MSYFKKVKEGDKVFGVIFGKGSVSSVFEGSFYTFEVEYETGDIVPYTEEGIPGWNSRLDEQTVFYKKDIDLFDLDISGIEKVLSYKKIIKLRDRDRLNVRCPSGVWKKVGECPFWIIEDYIEKEQFHLFNKSK